MSVTDAKKHAGILALAGFSAGLLNGLLGAGGGIVMTFALEYMIKHGGLQMEERDIFANVIAATLPISVMSALIYGVRGNIDLSGFSVFVLPAVVGGLVGAFFLSKISVVFLKRIFALLVIWSGIYMIIR